MNTVERIDEILADPAITGGGEAIGESREGRLIHAFRFGEGDARVSLLAGCHADEPVGPRLLRRLCAFLSSLPSSDPLLKLYEWWIVPHINPDGERRNRAWQQGEPEAYDLTAYLMNAVRELPGDDIEFGFPRDAGDRKARPENRSVWEWWESAPGPFRLHVSLHGMAFAAGPWFLIEPAWRDRSRHLQERCVSKVKELGYTLHDVERRGEKGFFRLARGFSTRPDSRYMREHFEALGDHSTAQLFRPSSMEAVRALGGEPLTLVAEMPLFITPGVGDDLGPPDPVAEKWRQRLEAWRLELEKTGGTERLRRESTSAGLCAMPVRDQLILQWTFVVAGLEQAESG